MFWCWMELRDIEADALAKIIVGLGNPGSQYAGNRHNVGFMVLEHFLKDYESTKETQWENSQKFKSDILQIEWQRRFAPSGQSNFEKVILTKPKTYMNNSGMAVQLIVSFYKVKPEDIWIIHDDFDLPLGSMKIRFGGASAGHHGVESIITALNTDKFWRYRMGTGESHSKETMAKHKIKQANDFVLSGFSKGEAGKIRELIKRGSKALQMALEEGMLASQNRFNTK